MLAFSITTSSLELVNSGAIYTADRSVLITGSPDKMASVHFVWWEEGVEPFATHIITVRLSQAGLEPGLPREIGPYSYFYYLSSYTDEELFCVFHEVCRFPATATCSERVL
jgi:hypothetical protein